MTQSNTWDWNKMLRGVDFHELGNAGYPGWDKTESHKPWMAGFPTVHGKDKGSRDIAIEFDDIAQGCFYYNDITASLSPIVRDGDTYRSEFYFQFKADFDKFCALLAIKAEGGE